MIRQGAFGTHPTHAERAASCPALPMSAANLGRRVTLSSCQPRSRNIDELGQLVPHLAASSSKRGLLLAGNQTDHPPPSPLGNAIWICTQTVIYFEQGKPVAFDKAGRQNIYCPNSRKKRKKSFHNLSRTAPMGYQASVKGAVKPLARQASGVRDPPQTPIYPLARKGRFAPTA